MTMKKKLSLLLAAILCLSTAACGTPASSSSEPAPSSQPPVEYSIPAPVFDTAPVALLQFEAPVGPTALIKTDLGDIEIMFFPEQAPKAVENFLTHAKAGYYDGLTFHRVLNDFMIQGGDPVGNGTGGESIWGAPFEDEFSDSLRNFRGALSMANSGTNSNGSQFFIVQSRTADLTGYLENTYGNYLFQQAQQRLQAKAAELTDQAQFEQYAAAEQAAFDKLFAAGPTEEFKKRLEPMMAKYEEVGGTPHLDNKHTVFGQVTKGMEVVDAIAAAPLNPDTDPNGGTPATPVKIISVTVQE